ncbi:MAG: glutathione S-transferase N-terminal domain-containing protein [Anaerolineae bacterium]|nr:glutathione S-transferase N-terminal domain-containing protein [Anaerolineae bacterium]
MARKDAGIVIYGTTWCPDCIRAKAFLDQRGVPYVWVNIEEDEAAAQVVLEKNGGLRVVPTILFPDGSVLVEPSNRELAQKLASLT